MLLFTTTYGLFCKIYFHTYIKNFAVIKYTVFKKMFIIAIIITITIHSHVGCCYEENTN